MARIKLTKRTIDALPPATNSRGEKHYDTELRGFGLASYPTGRKSFFIEYGPRGKRRRMILGPYGALTPDEARTMARDKLASVFHGRDPLADRDARRQVPTFREWTDEYVEEIKRRKKSWKQDRSHMARTCKRWGSRPLNQISVDDVRRMMTAYSEGHGKIAANRWLACVRASLNVAWRSDLIPTNPAARVQSNRENPPRNRVLDEKEMARVVQAIHDLDDPFARSALLLLIATGTRRTEVLSARWEDFDLRGATWRIPRPKAGHPQVVPLSEDTVELLRGMPRELDSPWLVPGVGHDGHRSDLKRAWATVLEKAEVENVHIHDLRRTFGLAVARTAGLHVASKLLRHSTVTVTEKVYAPLGLDDLRAGLEKSAEARPKVVPLRAKK
jgi:integrase